jgi:hypothetical protein
MYYHAPNVRPINAPKMQVSAEILESICERIIEQYPGNWLGSVSDPFQAEAYILRGGVVKVGTAGIHLLLEHEDLAGESNLALLLGLPPIEPNSAKPKKQDSKKPNSSGSVSGYMGCSAGAIR